MKDFDFEQELINAKKWEQLAVKELQPFMLHTKLIEYSENPEIQKAGIDVITTPHSITYDVKTRMKYYPDILIETVSNIERNIPGWWYTSKADALVYHWLNSQKNRSLKLYIIALQMLRDMDFLNNVLAMHPEIELKKSSSNNGTWHTAFYTVPINLFPQDCIAELPPLVTQMTFDDSSDFERKVWAILGIKDWYVSGRLH
jgi:hypothetical protein